MGGFNEVVLETGKRLDSYIPGKEIISRKFTQLGKVAESTAKSYIDELASKYAAGTPVKETARNVDAIAKGGKDLSGKLILECLSNLVKFQKKILQHAKEADVSIRDVL